MVEIVKISIKASNIRMKDRKMFTRRTISNFIVVRNILSRIILTIARNW